MSSFLHQTTTDEQLSCNDGKLYMSSFLHQTTTAPVRELNLVRLYMSSFLHQTTTVAKNVVIFYRLYMSSFLHQTTTVSRLNLSADCCICLLSYIKPQLPSRGCWQRNCCICLLSYIKPQLHDNWLLRPVGCICLLSYIKPQRCQTSLEPRFCCICLLSYIKPQQVLENPLVLIAVYVFFPTSNHNYGHGHPSCYFAVYVFFPTSNHNARDVDLNLWVLYMSSFLHQTTTRIEEAQSRIELYMSSFLHQTTTPLGIYCNSYCCICLLSYIKPQLLGIFSVSKPAVYVFFPTSNHNNLFILFQHIKLYMSSFLHQTTTRHSTTEMQRRCICLLSYIKPQLILRWMDAAICCICLLSYIKPQL